MTPRPEGASPGITWLQGIGIPGKRLYVIEAEVGVFIDDFHNMHVQYLRGGSGEFLNAGLSATLRHI